MAQTYRTDKRLEQTVAIGESNKALLPSLRNWCQYLLVEDQSAGMVYEMYQLPLTLRISCPHARGEYTGMQLEWNAKDFILENCIGCSFHKEKFTPNFGRKVINQHHIEEQKADRVAREQASQRQALRDAISDLVRKEQSYATITTLSILNLIQGLQATEERESLADTILEASSLSPQYFSDAALNFLALYFDDPSGEDFLNAVSQVQKHGKTLPKFAFEQVVATINKEQYTNAATGVFSMAVSTETLAEHEPVIAKIIDQLLYERNIGDPYESYVSYPNVVDLMSKLANADQNLFYKLLRHSLQSEDKRTRINILGLIQELIPTVPEHILPLTETITFSLDLPDDSYYDSADYASRQTLALLYKQNPDKVMSVLQQVQLRLSSAGQVELIKFYGRALSDTDLLRPTDAEIIINWLVTELVKQSGNEEVHKNILDAIEYAVVHVPALFTSYFEPLLGYLITSINIYNTFLWYKKELDKPADQVSTFNPLRGKHFTEVLLLESQHQKQLNDIEQILQQLLKQVGNSLHLRIQEVLNGLNSQTNGFVKSRLIKTLYSGVSDPLAIGDLLPTIYSSLFDMVSIDVRREAVRFVEHLLDKHPALVTQTLLDVIKVFLTDSNVSICALAIRAYQSLIHHYPEQVEIDHINSVLAKVTNEYTVLHKAAAMASYDILPFLTDDQKQLLITGLIVQERAYFKERDYEYCKTLVSTLLFLTKDDQRHFINIVHQYVVKYCTCGDYYMELYAIKRLTKLTIEFSELQTTWLMQALHYLIRVAPNFGALSEYREDLFAMLYQLPYETISTHQKELADFVRTQIRANRFFDVFSTYAVIGAQGLHVLLYELTQYFAKVVPTNKSNETVVSMNESFARLAELESTVEASQLNSTFVNTIRLQ